VILAGFYPAVSKYTYISHENLNKLFTVLKNLEGFDGESELEISVEDNRIIISSEVQKYGFK